MTWGWSHTTEAYVNARENVREQSADWIRVVWAEWKARLNGTDSDGDPRFSERKYAQALKRAQGIETDILADEVWDLMSEQARCTSGGWDAHACPYGCGCHMVSFDREKERAESES